MIKTNTLVFTNLSCRVFENNGHELQALLTEYGSLVRFVVLKSFGRILCVFSDTQIAIAIKEALHKLKFVDDIPMGVYYAQHTDLNCLDPEAGKRVNLLQIPEQERNFLLSPPGSPPVGWVQTSETEPSKGSYSEDIIQNAFSFISLNDFTLDGGRLVEFEPVENELSDEICEKLHHVLKFDTDHLPVIQIDLCPDDPDESHRKIKKIAKTARPPINNN